MYDIRQFRPTLYLLVLMGIVGFALAAEMPGFGLTMVFCLLLNAWLVKSGSFVPMPRWLAAGMTLGALGYTIEELVRLRTSSTPLLLIGQFLVFLQIVKLFEQRANRDYSQLLILSTLLMVASSISTGNVIFGLLLAVYLFLALYCWLLFHLKVDAEAARKAQTIPPDKLNSATLRQDQRYLPRSMRRLTWLIAGAAVGTSVLVFVAAPRNAGAGLLGDLQFQVPERLTGFSDRINFQDVARITQSQQVAARVWLACQGRPIEGGILVLRGRTLDHYDNKEWSQSIADELPRFYLNRLPQQSVAPWSQHVVLYPIGQPTLFCMAGPQSCSTESDIHILHNHRDQTLTLPGNPPLPEFIYDVASSDHLNNVPLRHIHSPMEDDAQIKAIANDPNICGQSGGKSLAELRNADKHPGNLVASDLDAQIAANFEKYLRTQFTYTLDLSGDRELMQQGDPLVVFLTKVKKGHCEYFAGAMTLLCQSLGMEARIVSGFKCDEFNSAGGYFEVRQSHAHAWVEVRTPNGWISFDPTSSNSAAARKRGFFQSLRNWYDYVQYAWGNSVVAYTGAQRTSLMLTIEGQLSRRVIHSGMAVYRWHWPPDWFTSLKHWWAWNRPGPRFFSLLCFALGLALIGWATKLRLVRWRLRRRAQRIGLDALTKADRFRIARQVGFYDKLIRLLEKHGLERAPSQTPLEFVESTRAAHVIPLAAYKIILRLTRIFYRVRFGRTELTGGQQRRLHSVVAGLDDLLVSTAPSTP